MDLVGTYFNSATVAELDVGRCKLVPRNANEFPARYKSVTGRPMLVMRCARRKR